MYRKSCKFNHRLSRISLLKNWIQNQANSTRFKGACDFSKLLQNFHRYGPGCVLWRHHNNTGAEDVYFRKTKTQTQQKTHTINRVQRLMGNVVMQRLMGNVVKCRFQHDRDITLKQSYQYSGIISTTTTF